MQSNTRLLVLFSLIIIISGFILLWFGLNLTPETKPQPPVSTVDNMTVASSPAEILESSASTKQAIQGVEGERVIVDKVVDGDTIDLKDGRVVRFVGIDTPETVDPRRPVGCFGKEASSETKSLLTGRMIIMQKDTSDTDKYKRLLRYIYLPLENGSMLFVNDYLVREGFAKVLTYPPDTKFDTRFKEAEKNAKENKKGLWGQC